MVRKLTTLITTQSQAKRCDEGLHASEYGLGLCMGWAVNGLVLCMNWGCEWAGAVHGLGLCMNWGCA